MGLKLWVKGSLRSFATKAEYLAIRANVRRRTAAVADRVILIAPPGNGNIGDQALVEAFIQNTPGQILLVTASREALILPSGDDPRLESVSFPGLLYGSSREHVVAARKFIREALPSAKAIAIVGADIMDGAYNRRASQRRFAIAQVFARSGIESRVLGFSWSETASTTNAARTAARSGVRLLARDPSSEQRLRNSGVPNVTLTADMAFLASKAPIGLVSEWRPQNTQYVVINASGLIARTHDLHDTYVDLVVTLVNRGLHVVLLPHVSRPLNDDLVELREVHLAVLAAAPQSANQMTLIDKLISPTDVRLLARDALFVVTGRMHLAVMALSESVPAITLSTQGKVEGLLRLFDLEHLCVTPDDVVNRLLLVTSKLEAELETRTEQIQSSLGSVEELASANFKYAA